MSDTYETARAAARLQQLAEHIKRARSLAEIIEGADLITMQVPTDLFLTIATNAPPVHLPPGIHKVPASFATDPFLLNCGCRVIEGEPDG